MFLIKKGKAPSYLCNRIRTHTDTHFHFTRNRDNIELPFARTKLRQMSYFLHISRKFNEFSKEINTLNISSYTFKVKCKKYLINTQ